MGCISLECFRSFDFGDFGKFSVGWWRETNDGGVLGSTRGSGRGGGERLRLMMRDECGGVINVGLEVVVVGVGFFVMVLELGFR